MLTRRLRTLFSAVALISLSVQASANSIYLSGPSKVNPGDSFTVSVFGDMPGGDGPFPFTDGGLYNGVLLLNYDHLLVTIDDITLNLPADPNFSCPGNTGGFCEMTPPGVARIAWGLFDGFGEIPKDTLMATIDATWIGGLGTVDFSLSNDLVAGGFIDMGFNIFEPDFVGTIVSTPVPMTFWLTGAGLLAMTGLRRRAN